MVVDGYHLVSVRAFERPGFDGFCRGGRRWPSNEDTFALVTPALLAVLKAEKRMLAVDTGVTLDAEALSRVGRFDVPARPAVDPIAVALDESRRLKAEKAALEAIAENEKLRAEIEALKAGAAKAAGGDKKAEKK